MRRWGNKVRDEAIVVATESRINLRNVPNNIPCWNAEQINNHAPYVERHHKIETRRKDQEKQNRMQTHSQL
jgi:hypothetical protein